MSALTKRFGQKLKELNEFLDLALPIGSQIRREGLTISQQLRELYRELVQRDIDQRRSGRGE